MCVRGSSLPLLQIVVTKADEHAVLKCHMLAQHRMIGCSNNLQILFEPPEVPAARGRNYKEMQQRCVSRSRDSRLQTSLLLGKSLWFVWKVSRSVRLLRSFTPPRNTQGKLVR